MKSFIRFPCPGVASARAWLVENRIMVLNLAGPRESDQPGIYAAAQKFLLKLLS